MSNKKIEAQCKENEYSYVSASGRWLPCCSFPDHGPELDRSIFSRDEFLIDNNDTFDQFHNLDIFKLWIDHIENNYYNANYVCKRRCGVFNKQIKNNDRSLNWAGESYNKITNQQELEDFLKDNN